MKGDILKQQVTLGCNHTHQGSGARHSYEILYDHLKSVKGFYGLPFVVAWAGEYALSSDITLKTKADIREDITVGFSWIHRFDKNLRFVFSDNFSLTKTISEPANSAYNFGLLLEWTI